MNHEQLLRTVAGAHIALFMALGAYHRFRSMTGESLRRTDEGVALMIALRLIGISAMAATFAYLVSPPTMRWAQVPLPMPVRWAGIALLWASGFWMRWMLRSLGKNLTDTVNVRAGATLVTTGPYRWVRHPMYLGVLGLMLSFSLIAANVYILAAGLTTFALLLLRSRVEEAKLEERFGEPYREYRRRTGLIFPKLSRA